MRYLQPKTTEDQKYEDFLQLFYRDLPDTIYYHSCKLIHAPYKTPHTRLNWESEAPGHAHSRARAQKTTIDAVRPSLKFSPLWSGIVSVSTPARHLMSSVDEDALRRT